MLRFQDITNKSKMPATFDNYCLWSCPESIMKLVSKP